MRLTVETVQALARAHGFFMWVARPTYRNGGRFRYTLYKSTPVGTEPGRYVASADTLASMVERIRKAAERGL